MKRITKRDLVFFVLGLFAFFLFETIYDWEENVKAIKAGYEDGYNSFNEQ
ncbi:hypothetical protein U3A58_14660 [Algoriphagus sp. C2-6-M1]|nr:hypothetical protein [Algoriphagus sp. C2-6-M1]MEB2781636.1 hypothetical protein [Algoriphagus sp. C2-6-M1]